MMAMAKYITKLNYISDNDIIRAYTDGDIKIPELYDKERVVGITFKSLDSLTPQDWHEWIVDRLLTGKHSELRPWYHARCGEEVYRYMLFQQLVGGNRKQRASLPVSDTFIPKLKRGYVITIPSLIDEEIPSSEIETWGQNYPEALNDLILMGSVVFTELYHSSLVPRRTKKQKIGRLQEIEKILTA